LLFIIKFDGRLLTSSLPVAQKGRFEMREIDVTRAWKDAEYRATLSADELANLPQNPVGDLEFELSDDELSLIAGAEGDGEIGDPIKPFPPSVRPWECYTLPPACPVIPTYIYQCGYTRFPPCGPVTDPRICDPAPTSRIVCPTFAIDGFTCSVLEDGNAIL
jgi:mersacidin/lichenicidin family type 2 lantibiotic